MLKFAVAVVAGELESVTPTVKLKVPAAVGVPDILPVDAASEMPPGKAPEVILHVYGALPCDAMRVVEYATFTCPPGTEMVVI
jgi:hypothetical protein